MDAGPALDAAVARRVMGWQREDGRPPWWWWHVPATEALSTRCAHDGTDTTPPYSTDMGAAWLVLEQLRETAHPIVLTDLGPAWALPYLVQVQVQGPPHTVVVRTASMPLSICLAALAVLDALAA